MMTKFSTLTVSILIFLMFTFIILQAESVANIDTTTSSQLQIWVEQ